MVAESETLFGLPGVMYLTSVKSTLAPSVRRTVCGRRAVCAHRASSGGLRAPRVFRRLRASRIFRRFAHATQGRSSQ